jgi:hypothetical protein
MKTPTLKQKVDQYEAFLHRINMCLISCNNEGIQELVQNADRWSYAHRVGNGELSDRGQQQLINNAFWKLLDTPKADEATKQRQKDWIEKAKQLEEAFVNND